MGKRELAFFILFGATLLGVNANAMGKKSEGAKEPPLVFSPAFVDTPSEDLSAPLTLEACYERALVRSETVAIRKEQIREAEARFFEATSVFLGDVDFVFTDFIQEEVKGEVSDEGVRTTLNDPERVERKFVIRQPLFQGFKTMAGLSAASSFKKQRSAEWRRAAQLLYQDVSLAYLQSLLHKKEIEVIEGVLALYEERLKDLSEREKIGRSRESELATARSRMRILEAELAQERGGLAVSLTLLEFLTGMPIGIEQLQEVSLPTEERELEHCLMAATQRPDVEASRQGVRNAWSQVVAAQSGFWPLVSLENNQYDRREGFQSDISWDLLFRADIPLFRGGENLGKMKVALSRFKQAKLTQVQSLRQASLEVRQTYRQWETSLTRYFSLQEAVKASEENFRLQQEDYNRNLVSNLDVLAALEQLDETRREAHRSAFAVSQNHWRLRVAMGETP